MRYFVSPVQSRPLKQFNVAQLVEQLKPPVDPLPLRNKEDAVGQRYFAPNAKTNTLADCRSSFNKRCRKRVILRC